MVNQLINRISNVLVAARQIKASPSSMNELSELLNSLSELKDDLFSLKCYQLALESSKKNASVRIDQLEGDIVKLKQRQHLIEHFESCQLPAGTFVYRWKDMQDTHAPCGYYCPKCMHEIGAAPLMVVRGEKSLFLDCSGCAARFAYRSIAKNKVVSR